LRSREKRLKKSLEEGSVEKKLKNFFSIKQPQKRPDSACKLLANKKGVTNFCS
jgi:hypothetical protein